MSKNKYFVQFLSWRARKIPDTSFVLFLSVIIGFAAGIAAALLKFIVISIKDKLLSYYGDSDDVLLFMVLPLLGILLTVLFLRYIVKDNVGHGVPRILYVISKLDGSMRYHKIFSSLVGGSLTAGFGGSVGLESPIISTGASIGSSIGQFLKMGYKHKTLLIGCGAAGAMASIFTTPVAAVIFSFEVLMLDLTTASFIPLLFASVTGAVTAKLLTSEQYLVHFNVAQPFEINDLPFFIILGVVGGFVSVYFHYMHFSIIRLFKKIKSVWARLFVGGSLLGLVLYIFPPLFSEGYDSIRLIVSGHAEDLLHYTFLSESGFVWTLILFTIFLVVFKVIATTLTTEAGGVGGIFAPAAVMGGYSGFALSKGLNELFSSLGLHENNFVLVGMATVLGGVLLAPLTAIFLVAEMSSGYQLIVPLMLSTSIAYLIARTFNKHSIFTQQLAEKGEMFHYRDQTVIKQMRIENLLEKDARTISINSTLGDLVKTIKKSSRNFFAVIDDEGTFIGMVLLDDVRKDMFNRLKYKIPITDYLHQTHEDEKVTIENDVQEIVNKFYKSGNYNMIVVDGSKYVGIISRANLFKSYRESMLEETKE
ncbi:MAG: chloride channel protein [Bacteroidetes bacterium]|nr:MAG: chloride channel protein [Bacteroidota bacterium]